MTLRSNNTIVSKIVLNRKEYQGSKAPLAVPPISFYTVQSLMYIQKPKNLERYPKTCKYTQKPENIPKTLKIYN